MTAIKRYLLRLLLCSLLVSLPGPLVKGKAKGIVKLCGGCLLILAALEPLVQVDFTSLPDLGRKLGLSQIEGLEAAREKNELLLKQLVESQTQDWLQSQGEALGIEAAYTVTAGQSPEGLWVPERVEIRGYLSPEQKQALSRLIGEGLSLPNEALRWGLP